MAITRELFAELDRGFDALEQRLEAFAQRFDTWQKKVDKRFWKWYWRVWGIFLFLVFLWALNNFVDALGRYFDLWQ